MHKPTLRKERAIRYDKNGAMEMINNLDKVSIFIAFHLFM